MKVGSEWSRISALFSAAEEFCGSVRDKRDKWNTYIGSGIVSAVLRINEGPVGVAQGIFVIQIQMPLTTIFYNISCSVGFAAGFGFFYAIDLLIPGAANVNVPIDDVATSIKISMILSTLPQDFNFKIYYYFNRVGLHNEARLAGRRGTGTTSSMRNLGENVVKNVKQIKR